MAKTLKSDPFLEEILPHREALFRVAARMGLDGDDLVQQTYLHALVAKGSYRPGSNARAWLSRILVNLGYSEYRRRDKDRRLGQSMSRGEPWQLPARSLGERGTLALAWSRLGIDERRLIVLAEVDGLAYREIASRLGCPIGTVMSSLHRARRRLRHAATERQPCQGRESLTVPASPPMCATQNR